MTTQALFHVPPVTGTIRTAQKTHKGVIMPGVFKSEGDNVFIGVVVDDETIVFHKLTQSLLNDRETLKVLARRTLWLMSALLVRGSTVDDELTCECWIAANLRPRVGPNGNAERLETARANIRHHLGQDVATYLREQECYVS